MEFYLFFLDLLGKELTAAIEESCSRAWIPHQLNLTFITLIPKVDKQGTFDDSRPISLCNLYYKLITKILLPVSRSLSMVHLQIISTAIGGCVRGALYPPTSSSWIWKHLA